MARLKPLSALEYLELAQDYLLKALTETQIELTHEQFSDLDDAQQIVKSVIEELE